MRDEQDGRAVDVYLNRAERNLLICAFGTMSVLMATGVWATHSAGSRFLAACAAVGLAFIAARATRRPSVVVDQARLLVRSGVLNRSIERSSIQDAEVETTRVGAFRRSGLFLKLRDGTQVNLAKWGIWAAAGSADEGRLIRVADRISSGTR